MSGTKVKKRNRKPLPDKEVLEELLTYDPETGVFTWKWRPEHYFQNHAAYWAWNQKHKNKRAGCVNPEGYRQIRILDTVLQENRLAYYWVHGEQPQDVDHKNGVVDDNRICNLRGGSHKANQRNMKLRKDSKSGYTGIREVRGRFQVRNWNGTREQSKTFDTLEEAIAFREAYMTKHYQKEHGMSAEDKSRVT